MSPFLATADTIVLNFSGTINFSASVDQIPEGTPYSGRLVYTVPSALLGTIPADSLYLYNFNDPGNGLTISIGPYTFSSAGTLGNQASVLYQSNYDDLNGNDAVTFYTGASGYSPAGNLPGYTLLVLGAQFMGSPGFISSPALPTEMNFADLLQIYNAGYKTSIVVAFDNGTVLGTVDSVQLVHVLPEPSTMSLTVLATVIAGVIGENDPSPRITRRSEFISKISATLPRLLCALIHKFDPTTIKEPPPKTIGRFYIFVGECHRTQGGAMHKQMKRWFPNAIFIGFTGTPLLRKDKQTTLDVFGTNIHTYKFKEAVQDKVILDLK